MANKSLRFFLPWGLELRSPRYVFDQCFTKVKLMDSGDEDINIPGLVCYPVCQEYFYCCLIVLI